MKSITIKDFITGFLLALVIFGLFGCSGETGAEVSERTRQNASEQVSEVYLEDGTRCIVYGAGRRGGITCDFETE